MEIFPHEWNLSPEAARDLQRTLEKRLLLRPLPPDPKVLGASDIGYSKATDLLVAVVLTFAWPNPEPLEAVHVVSKARFPYIPGLLSFREVPSLLEAFGLLENKPDVLLCDGHGIAHPRGIGLASHLGLALGVPTIGCAKKRLCGTHEHLDFHRGSAVPLFHRGATVGAVFRSRDGVKPIYISPGHLCDIDGSVDLIRRCLGRYRIPEPLRQAHNLATQLRRELSREHSLQA